MVGCAGLGCTVRWPGIARRIPALRAGRRVVIFAPGLLKDQVAIVTGGGTGIGRGIALEIARAGGTVVLAGRRQEPLDAVAAEVAGLGGQGRAISTDVREMEQVERMVRTAEEAYGRIDLLVNNAGGQFGAPFEKITANGWRSVIDVNLNGVFNCIQACAPAMIRQQKGKVVTVIAGFTRRAAPYVAHSGAARAAVENLTRSLAVEWAHHNIQLNCISPVALTEAFARNSGRPEAVEELRTAIPSGRFASLEEVGWLVVYLASRAGNSITGEHILMDGAYWLATGLRHGLGAPGGQP